MKRIKNEKHRMKYFENFQKNMDREKRLPKRPLGKSYSQKKYDMMKQAFSKKKFANKKLFRKIKIPQILFWKYTFFQNNRIDRNFRVVFSFGTSY